MNWLSRARREFQENAQTSTAITAERPLTAVMAVTQPDICETLGVSNGSFGSTTTPFVLSPDLLTAFEERAAIMEFDGGLSRPEAEARAVAAMKGKT